MLASIDKAQCECLVGPFRRYAVTIGELLDDLTEAVDPRIADETLCAAGPQTGYAQLEVARLDVDADAELIATHRAVGVRDQCIGEQLHVRDSIRREVGSRCERAHKSRKHGARQTYRGDAHRDRLSRVRKRKEREALLLSKGLEHADMRGCELHLNLRPT